MDQLRDYVGGIVLYFGGLFLTLAIVGFIFWIMCSIWIAASNKFRNICKAESLIFEYRKYRNEFLFWREHKDGTADAPD